MRGRCKAPLGVLNASNSDTIQTLRDAYGMLRNAYTWHSGNLIVMAPLSLAERPTLAYLAGTRANPNVLNPSTSSANPTPTLTLIPTQALTLTVALQCSRTRLSTAHARALSTWSTTEAATRVRCTRSCLPCSPTCPLAPAYARSSSSAASLTQARWCRQPRVTLRTRRTQHC